jgi:hypothetical protein
MGIVGANAGSAGSVKAALAFAGVAARILNERMRMKK